MSLADILRAHGLDANAVCREVPYIQAPAFWFRGPSHMLQSGSGSAVRVLIDLSGNGHHAIQTDTGKQGAVGTDADGNTEIAVSSDCYAVAAGGGWPAGTSHSFWAEIDPTDASTQLQYLFEALTGNLVIAAVENNVGKVGIWDGGAWRTIADAVTGEQSLEFHLDDTGNTVTAYRTGKFIGSSTYGASTALGGTSAIFSRQSQTSRFFAGAGQELWLRDSLQSVAEQFASRQYRAARYPTRWADTLPLVVPVATSATAGAWFDTRAVGNFVVSYLDAAGEQLTNGDFETGDPPTGWTAQNSATLSSQTGTRTGGSGTKVMRVAWGGSANPHATESVCVGSAVYHVTGWARSDGTGVPSLKNHAGALQWTGTTSTDWQYIDAVFTQTGALIRFGDHGGLSSAGYVEFDDLSVVECPPIIVAKDCSRSVDDPIADGDMEAVGTADWTSVSGGVLSKQGGAYEGSQCLRVTIPIADSAGLGRQSVLNVGERYLVQGRAQGDGTNGYPEVTDGSGAFWTGTTTNTWQECVGVLTTVAGNFSLVVRGDAATEDYAEFDAFTVTPGNHGYQATSANRPTYDSVNQCMTFTAASTERIDTGIIPGSEGTVSLWLRMPSYAATLHFPVGCYDGNRCQLLLHSNGSIGFYFGNEVSKTHSQTLSLNTWTKIDFDWSTVTNTIGIAVNGSRESASAAGKTNPTARTLYVGARNNAGSADYPCNVDVSHFQYRPYVCSTAMISYLYALGRT